MIENVTETKRKIIQIMACREGFYCLDNEGSMYEWDDDKGEWYEIKNPLDELEEKT